MRFVPKFHRELIIKLIIFTAVFFALFLAAVCSGDMDGDLLKTFLIQSFGLYIFTVVYFVISWIVLNLIENKYVYEAENENYYRDMIKNISPAQLSYIDDYGIETKKDILATFLMLHIKGNIKIKRNKIELISKYKMKEEEYYNLSRTETMVLECISKNKSPLKMPNTFEKMLLEDLDEAKLIEKEDTFPPHFYIKKVLQIIYGLFLIICARVTNILISPFMYGGGIVVFIYSIMWLASSNNYNLNKPLLMESYKKLTPKGNEIRLKLTGLKSFLRDYSLMKFREVKEIELWDEYMIYSVILNDNKKAQKQIREIIKRQYK